MKTVTTQTADSDTEQPTTHAPSPNKEASDSGDTEQPTPHDRDQSDSDVEPLPSSSDPPYEPESSSSSPTSSDSEEDDEEDSSSTRRDKYIVFEECLNELFKSCLECGGPVLKKTKFTTGSIVTFHLECHAGHHRTWRSQPVVKKAPLGNVLLSAAILFSGLCYTAVCDMARCLGLQFLSRTVFCAYQKKTLVPVIQEAWELEREGIALELKEGDAVTLAGDARCDTPGHNAKYGSCTLMHIDGDGQKGIKRIVAMELIQVSEVSCHPRETMSIIVFYCITKSKTRRLYHTQSYCMCMIPNCICQTLN